MASLPPRTFPSRSGPVDRLLFAIKPDSEIADRIEELRRGWRRRRLFGGGAEVGKPRLHSTLVAFHLMARIPTELVEAAEQAAREVAAVPFEVTFDRVKTVGGWVSLDGGAGKLRSLATFKDAVRRSVVRAGLGGFLEPASAPHMTLGYGNRRMISGAIPPLSWTVRDFVLIQSLVGRTRHIELARWPLDGLRRHGGAAQPGVGWAMEEARP